MTHDPAYDDLTVTITVAKTAVWTMDAYGYRRCRRDVQRLDELGALPTNIILQNVSEHISRRLVGNRNQYHQYHIETLLYVVLGMQHHHGKFPNPLQFTLRVSPDFDHARLRQPLSLVIDQTHIPHLRGDMSDDFELIIEFKVDA